MTGVCDRSCFWTREPAAAPAGSQSDLKTGEHRTTAAGWCSVWRFCEAKSQHEGHHKCHIKATKKMPQKRKSSKHHVLVAMLVIFEGCKIYASWGQKKIHRWNLDFRHLDGRPPIQTGNLGLYHELGKVQLACWFACIPALTMFWKPKLPVILPRMLSGLNPFIVQAELLGLQGEINVQGEDQKKLDVRKPNAAPTHCYPPRLISMIASHTFFYLFFVFYNLLLLISSFFQSHFVECANDANHNVCS